MNTYDTRLRGHLQVVLTSALGSFIAAALLYTAQRTLGLAPTILAPALAFLVLLTLLSWLYREMNHRRYTLQGEDVEDFEGCGFGKEDDPVDESGESIVNYRRSGLLRGRLPRLGRPGQYLANMRFKKLVDSDDGEFILALRVGDRGKEISSSISLSRLPFLQYQYLDLQFYYDGISTVELLVRPAGRADRPRVIGVDRFDCYWLPKARIMEASDHG